MSSGSSGAADKRPPPALPRQYQDQQRTPFFTWARLAIGSVLAVAAPFLHSIWASFLRIRSEVEMVKARRGRWRRSSRRWPPLRRRYIADKKNHLFMQVDEIEDDVKAIIEPIVDHSKHVHARARHTSTSSQK
ncbi:hypothetical protein BAE44_0005742 [Dichanthelium oligosanthes]|uniref:Uncharacterized protein n=1 Tax=Dichanthelium oligosanthes TaxID=888268 RepID=A0A1E5W747_9POAL|nr:hypothetical protein BAE44_0005742 [Dichanthelium oligosanthes]